MPNSPLYSDRRIDLYSIIHENDRNPDGSYRHDSYDIHDVIATGFKTGSPTTAMFVLSDQGFYRIGYENVIERASLDTISELKEGMATAFGAVLKRHVDKFHLGEQKEWFESIAGKINQFSDRFSMFDLVPTEFDETQDIGVVPDSKVDDLDESSDHRPDSVVVSTDVLLSQGMVADSSTNPGVVSAAASSPATIYDDDTIYQKSQRNPLIEGTEFYDLVYDQDGDTLMDLYAIPFIYQVNSNNTYDLYVNVPTTRTKYLGRIAGSLKSDLVSQVQPGDSYPRRNFGGESLPNNLDESTTHLKLFIDRKYISVGSVDMVEICGNSIPLQICREGFNDGLYDSMALESRWNGEVEEIVHPEKDINKVALEFECYGTDSQSIHISGKTLVHHVLDDSRYVFGDA